MKNKFKEIFNAIRKFQSLANDINSIEEKEKNLKENSEYANKSRELIAKFTNEGIYYTETFDSFGKDLYNEQLAFFEEKVKNASEVTFDFGEEELAAYYNTMLTDEEKKKYHTIEEFKNSLIEEAKKESIARINRLNELLNEFKNLAKYKDDLNKELDRLAIEKKQLIDAKSEIIETKLKNIWPELQEKGFQMQYGFPVISDDMRVVYNVPNLDADNLSIDDLVMVHATRFFPKDGVVRTLHDSVERSNRNTIHTALNGKVSSHMYGNWDDCSIIILDPLKKHIDQVACVFSVDTFTYGSMKLSDEAMLLIDINKFYNIYKENKDYIDRNRDRVVLYSGDSSIAVENMLSILGYAPQKIGQWSWDNEYASKMLNLYIQKNYPDKLTVSHEVTPHKTIEEGRVRRSVLNAYGIVDEGKDMIIGLDILYFMRENNKEYTIEDFIKTAGILVKDNEIHLLGIKDHIALMEAKEIPRQQIEKVELLLKKYELLREYQKDNDYNEGRKRA